MIAPAELGRKDNMDPRIIQFLENLKSDRTYKDMWVHHEYTPPAEAKVGEPAEPLDERTTKWLVDAGITNLYSHQAACIDLIRSGYDVLAATPTASGKSLIYNIPVLESILTHPQSKALYLFPFKALGQDQSIMLQGAASYFDRTPESLVAVYDGDVPSHKRTKIRSNTPNILISNPDMLHRSFLPYHESWSEFFQNLKFIVIDEIHTYRGIFGSNVAFILRRLLRIARHYGVRPSIISASATIANPGELFDRLTNREARVVKESGAPTPGKHFVILNPELSSMTVASRLLRVCVNSGLKTIVFTKARKITELIYAWSTGEDQELKDKIGIYRAGFLPEERRETERKLFSGKLKGVVSTSALELGIDVGGLDVCILSGYPGTIVSTQQRGGRVGRRGKEPLVFMIAGQDALDQYFVKHPDVLFGLPFEKAGIDPENRYIAEKQLMCAAFEAPIEEDELNIFGKQTAALVNEMEESGKLLTEVDRLRWHSVKDHPERQVDIRSAGDSFTIVEEGAEHRVIGRMSGTRAFHEGHPGAVYLHGGETYHVLDMDLNKKSILVRRTKAAWYTQTRNQKETEILDDLESASVGRTVMHRGRIKVTELIDSYVKKRIHGGDILGRHDLDLPPLIFETTGVWFQFDEKYRMLLEDQDHHFMGAIHACEHVILSLYPLFTMCDRFDVGGISFPFHPQTKTGAVFIYDYVPGGIGIAEKGITFGRDLLQRTLDTIESCECTEGCPSCIFSPRCGAGNRPLDKQGAVLLLTALLDENFRWPEKTKKKTVPKKIPLPRLPSQPEPEAPPLSSARKGRILVFDLETQNSSDDVGGWSNIKKMKLSVGVVYDVEQKRYEIYYEKQARDLIQRLEEAEVIIGFNQKRFDYTVLKGYSKHKINKIRNIDILEDVADRLGHRLSLDHLAEQTLGARKSGDGLAAIRWFREAKWNLLTEYCRKDVEITWKLFRYGYEKRHLIYRSRKGFRLKFPVNWHKKYKSLNVVVIPEDASQ